MPSRNGREVLEAISESRILQLVSCLMHVLEELFIREHGIERQQPVLLPNLPKDVKDII